MDAERRHHLRENDLAHGLTVTRDFFEQHSKQITVVAVTALALFAIGSFVVRSRAESHQDIWRQKHELKYENAQQGLQSIDRLLALANETSDRRFTLDALAEAGRQALRLAKEAPFPPDRQLNERARTAFEELMRRYQHEPLAVGVALAGLATVEENAFVLDHNLAHKEKAREYLTRLSSEAQFAGLPFQRMALDRLKNIDGVFQVTEFAPPAPSEPETPAEGQAEEQVDELEVPTEPAPAPAAQP